ncbi:MAG: class I SAM-dependent methyltransferase, partial [Patescibacteria group bacterium]
SEFWVTPDHLSYFNKEGLINLVKAAGWKNKFVMGDNPIDFNLLNENTNYAKDKSKGKSCHKARIEIDNLMDSISVEKAVDYYRALGQLGLGREIVALFAPII